MNLKNSKNTGNEIDKKTSGKQEVILALDKIIDKVESTLEMNGGKELIKLCNLAVKYTRIYLLRHPKYLDNDEYNEYKGLREQLKSIEKGESKLDGEKFDYQRYGELDSDIVQIDVEKINKELFDTIFKNRKVIFIHNPRGNSKLRIKQSIDYIFQNYLDIEDLEKEIIGSKKGEYSKQMSVIKSGEELVIILDEIKGNINEYEGREIVILGSRSHSHYLNPNKIKKIGTNDLDNEFKRKGYDFIEIDETGKIITDPYRFIITPENYKEIIKIFLLEGENISLIHLENGINLYFQKNPELYKKYVFSKNHDIQIFCIFNLIKNNETKILNEIFRDEKIRKEIKLEEYEKGDKKIYNILRYYLEVYPELLIIRKKSLDERINNGENIDPDFNFDRAEYNEVLELINRGKPIKYIEGKAGAGKSFLLSHIAERLNEENLNNNGDLLFNINFLSLTGIKDFKEIKFKVGYENILLIDSVDESSIYGEKIKELDLILLELANKGFKIIITSREGYLYDYSNDLEKNNEQYNLLDENRDLLKLLDFNISDLNKYLDIYFGDDKKGKDTLLKINKKLNGIGNNPLILSMLCDLVKNGYEEEEDEDGCITNIGLDFVSIINIYDEIIKLRLKNWNFSNENRKIDFDSITKKLEKFAYSMLFEKKQITNIILKQELGGYNDIHLKDNIEGINIFFKNSSIDNNYEFIHQSFKEYFAAKYVFEDIKINHKFDYEKFLCHDFKNIDLNFIDIFYDFIKNDDKIKALLLKNIEDNQDYYSPFIHHKIIYLLGKLSDFKTKLYLVHITPNEKVLEVLAKIGGEFYIDYIGKFINGKNPILRKKAVEIFDGLGLERKGKEVVKTDILLKNNKKPDFESPNLFIIKEIEKIIKDGLGNKGSYIYLKSQMTYSNVDIKIYIVDQILKFSGNTETDWFKEVGGKNEIVWLREILKQHLETPYYKEQESYYKKLIFFIISKIIEFGGEKEIEWLKSQIGNYEIGIKNFIISKIIEFGGEKEIEWLKSQIGKYEMLVDEYLISNIILIGGNKEAEWIKKLILDGKNKRLYKVLIYSLGYIGGKDNVHFIRSLLKYKSGLINKHVYGISKEIGGIGNISFARRI